MLHKQRNPGNDSARLNQSLRQAERALLIPEGLPNRPWFVMPFMPRTVHRLCCSGDPRRE